MIRLTITKTDAAAMPPVLLVQAPLRQRMGRPPYAESAKVVPVAKSNGQVQR
jgi:hypothetical protein